MPRYPLVWVYSDEEHNDVGEHGTLLFTAFDSKGPLHKIRLNKGKYLWIRDHQFRICT